MFPIVTLPPTSLAIPSLRVIPVHQPCLMHRTWTGDLVYIIYMFQCYSFKSSHPRLLPQSPKVCSLHLCLFCCLAYRVIVTIFLNSIYMHSVQFSSVTQSCPTLPDPMNRSTPGLPVHHQLPEFTQTHVH